jgi:hypothetical protein
MDVVVFDFDLKYKNYFEDFVVVAVVDIFV